MIKKDESIFFMDFMDVIFKNAPFGVVLVQNTSIIFFNDYFIGGLVDKDKRNKISKIETLNELKNIVDIINYEDFLDNLVNAKILRPFTLFINNGSTGKRTFRVFSYFITFSGIRYRLIFFFDNTDETDELIINQVVLGLYIPIIEKIRVGVLILNHTYKILFINRFFMERITPLMMDNAQMDHLMNLWGFIGRINEQSGDKIDFIEHLIPEFRARWEETLERVKYDGSGDLKLDFEPKGGDSALQNGKMWVKFSIQRISLERGLLDKRSREFFIILAYDISDSVKLDEIDKMKINTEQRKLTDILNKLREEVERRKKIEEILREEKERAEQANYIKSEFIANMSHELKNPLNSITGYTQLLEDGLLDYRNNGQLNIDEMLDYVYVVEENAKNLLKIINSILDLSKLEMGVQTLTYSEVDLDKILKDLKNVFLPMASEKNIEILIEISDISRFYADEDRLRHILSNLLSNAIKFTDNNKRVGIKVKRDRNQVVFIVWDEGIGIKQEDLPKLFRPFRQLESPYHKRYSGTGIGLYYTKKLVDVHKGSIKINSVFGKGTQIEVRLPYHEEDPTKIRPFTVVFTGLDGSGKSSLVKMLINKTPEKSYFPTDQAVKFEFEKGPLKYIFWDLPGKQRSRPIWNKYLEQSDLIIYVIDVSQISRYSEAKLELTYILKDPRLAPIPKIVVLNKIENFNSKELGLMDAQTRLLGDIDLEANHIEYIIKIGIDLRDTISSVQSTIEKVIEKYYL